MKAVLCLLSSASIGYAFHTTDWTWTTEAGSDPCNGVNTGSVIIPTDVCMPQVMNGFTISHKASCSSGLYETYFGDSCQGQNIGGNSSYLFYLGDVTCDGYDCDYAVEYSHTVCSSEMNVTSTAIAMGCNSVTNQSWSCDTGLVTIDQYMDNTCSGFPVYSMTYNDMLNCTNDYLVCKNASDGYTSTSTPMETNETTCNGFTDYNMGLKSAVDECLPMYHDGMAFSYIYDCDTMNRSVYIGTECTGTAVDTEYLGYSWSGLWECNATTCDYAVMVMYDDLSMTTTMSPMDSTTTPSPMTTTTTTMSPMDNTTCDYDSWMAVSIVMECMVIDISTGISADIYCSGGDVMVDAYFGLDCSGSPLPVALSLPELLGTSCYELTCYGTTTTLAPTSDPTESVGDASCMLSVGGMTVLLAIIGLMQ